MTDVTEHRHTPLFTVTLFTRARTWKQPRYPLTDVVHRYNGMLLAIKRNKFESVEVKWLNLDPVTQSEVSQKEKNKYHTLVHMSGEGNGTPLQSYCLENPMDGRAW